MVPGDHLLLNAETLLGWVTCSMGRCWWPVLELFKSECSTGGAQLKVNFWHAWLNWLACWCLHVLHSWINSWIILGFLFLGLILGFIILGFLFLGLILGFIVLGFFSLGSGIGLLLVISGWTSLSTLSSHSWSFSGLQRQVVCWKLAVGCHGLWHLLVSFV